MLSCTRPTIGGEEPIADILDSSPGHPARIVWLQLAGPWKCFAVIPEWYVGPSGGCVDGKGMVRRDTRGNDFPAQESEGSMPVSATLPPGVS